MWAFHALTKISPQQRSGFVEFFIPQWENNEESLRDSSESPRGSEFWLFLRVTCLLAFSFLCHTFSTVQLCFQDHILNKLPASKSLSPCFLFKELKWKELVLEVIPKSRLWEFQNLDHLLVTEPPKLLMLVGCGVVRISSIIITQFPSVDWGELKVGAELLTYAVTLVLLQNMRAMVIIGTIELTSIC